MLYGVYLGISHPGGCSILARSNSVRSLWSNSKLCGVSISKTQWQIISLGWQIWMLAVVGVVIVAVFVWRWPPNQCSPNCPQQQHIPQLAPACAPAKPAEVSVFLAIYEQLTLLPCQWFILWISGSFWGVALDVPLSACFIWHMREIEGFLSNFRVEWKALDFLQMEKSWVLHDVFLIIKNVVFPGLQALDIFWQSDTKGSFRVWDSVFSPPGPLKRTTISCPFSSRLL